VEESVTQKQPLKFFEVALRLSQAILLLALLIGYFVAGYFEEIGLHAKFFNPFAPLVPNLALGFKTIFLYSLFPVLVFTMLISLVPKKTQKLSLILAISLFLLTIPGVALSDIVFFSTMRGFENDPISWFVFYDSWMFVGVILALLQGVFTFLLQQTRSKVLKRNFTSE
jgi:hypothetical protein